MKYGAKGERGRITPNSAINPIKFSAAEYFLRAVRNVRNGGDRDRRPQRSYPAFYREIIGTVLNRPFPSPFRPSTSEEGWNYRYRDGDLTSWGEVWHNRVLTRRDKPRLAKNPTRAREGNLRKLSFRRSDLSGSEGRCVDFQMIFESRVAISFLLQQRTLLAFFFFFAKTGVIYDFIAREPSRREGTAFNFVFIDFSHHYHLSPTRISKNLSICDFSWKFLDLPSEGKSRS